MKRKTQIIIAITFLLLITVTGICLLLYKYTTLFDKNQWTITQYGPRHTNSSFYTIYNPKEGLIVVDGGWTEDAQYVKDILNLLGNEVDLWILTHPHEDHLGAFNTIYPDRESAGITIHKVLTVDMATPEECLETAPWDNADAYRNFLALDIDNLEYVSMTDTFEMFDLQFEVFSTFGSHVRDFSKDYLNDGSMMFKVTHNTQSMLFCSDVGVGISDYLLNYWQDSLKADFLQMGHHGYGGLNDSFYRTVSPKAAFFDAPEQMMFDETGRFDNPEHMKLMESMGCDIYYFKDGPNSIILE